MQDKDYTNSLLQTKLHRPALPVELVSRSRLTELLDSQTLPPLILISAPAGYGKSTLSKCLVKALDYPNAWLSLDENDNDLRIFIHYFVAAVQNIFSNALPETQALLMTTPLPPISAISKILINELDQIEQPFALVLDDYHVIETQTIHELLNELLLHPPRNLHLVLSTRVDPLLPLVTLRANNQMVEFRTQDLRFTREETLDLFQKMIRVPIEPATIKEVDAQAEGWVTGLRLAALAMRHRIGRDSLQGEFSLQNRYVTEYLVSEILTKQAPILSDGMLKTSILGRFCADLCEAVWFQNADHADSGKSSTDFSGTQFIEWLQASNLFVVPLDDRDEWYRYHHLFRDLLQQELTRRLNNSEIAELHAAAGRWFARKGWIEEALFHLLATGDTDAAIELIAQHRLCKMNATQWPRLEQWLNLFPNEIVETSAELWILKIWLVYHRGQFAELPALLGHLDAIYDNEHNQAAVNDLAGEISSLRALIEYYQGNADQAVSLAKQALILLPPDFWIVRVFTRTYLSGSYLLRGEKNKGYQAYYDAFQEEKIQDKQFKATLLMSACNFHWLTADLNSMAQAAKQCIALSQETGQRQIFGFGNYHLARVRYHQDNLPVAEQLFSSVVARPYLNYGIAYTNSACGLAFTYQAQGQETKAQQVSEDAIAFLLETGNTTQLPIALTLQAELALMQGHISLASQWAEKLDPVPPLATMPWFLASHLTLVKVWLAQNTPASQVKATELVNQLREYLTSIHNTRFLIETLALQALLTDACGDQAAALDALEKALHLAQPGGFIRLFVDLGPSMAHLLAHLKLVGELHAYANRIQSAFPESQPAKAGMSQGKLIEPLTNRELEVLSLLAERKTNKEIALQLGITLGTVRQHSYNLYQKLDVGNRRQAVTRAFELGVLKK